MRPAEQASGPAPASQPRVRRTPPHRQVQIRLADPYEGPKIGEFLTKKDPVWAELDWSRASSWLMAFWRGEIVGVVQVHFGLPVGRLETLTMSETLGVVQRGVVLLSLVEYGSNLLRSAGSQGLFASIPKRHTSYRDCILERGGSLLSDDCSLVCWEI